jgi:FkbM family methyltransferase
MYLLKLGRMTFQASSVNDLVYDVGMHNGDDTAFYLARGFRVIAVEANPAMAAAAGSRFRSEIESKRLTILNVAIAEQRGEAEFWVSEIHSCLSSFDRNLAGRNGEPHHSIMVPCERLDAILAKYGIPL